MIRLVHSLPHVNDEDVFELLKFNPDPRFAVVGDVLNSGLQFVCDGDARGLAEIVDSQKYAATRTVGERYHFALKVADILFELDAVAFALLQYQPEFCFGHDVSTSLVHGRLAVSAATESSGLAGFGLASAVKGGWRMEDGGVKIEK
jgi:hypothetical protein